ncbi:MAG TPA: efflux RND transporter permease subunit [Vicinamibacterales bacterium]|nr:efflux RND transporter permease subunit [Vicinamibacterales bacterium]
MWIVRIALDRPYTFVVMALAIILMTPVALLRTPTDILPQIDIPVIGLVFSYGGLAPQEMERRITSNAERGITTLVNDVEHIESQTLSGLAVLKVFFQPTANVQTAMAQTTSVAQTLIRQMPPGTTPPLVVLYSASTVPVLQLGLTSDTMSEQQLFDFGNNFLRTQLATVQGAAAPFPYGGKQRLISVDLDPEALQSKGLLPTDIVNAIAAQNLILPSGTTKLGSLEYAVEMNGSPTSIAGLNELPVKTERGATIYMKDVAHIRDGNSPQTNIVRMDGRRGTLMSIYKSGNASTLDIVARVRDVIARARGSMPPALRLTELFDQSLFVRAAVEGVFREALLAAGLTAIMILVFLGDWRSTVIIAVSIPLSIMVSIITLGAIGQTINLMTLGGLALAVGILVDDATVAIENIDRNLAMGKEPRAAILEGSQEIAVPALVSTLCICIVFVPMFFLSGVARYLFVPLAEAVVFAMLASYVLSRTLVPTMALYLMRKGGTHAAHTGKSAMAHVFAAFENAFERFRAAYRRGLAVALERRGIFAGAFLLCCIASMALVVVLGQDFFPTVDAGQIRLHLRARTGLRIEETARLADQVDAVIRRTIGADLVTVLDNIGVPYSGINLTYSNGGTIGTADAEVLVQLKKERRVATADHIRKLRGVLHDEFPGVEFFFQPADIVTQILNFGKPAPIDVAVTGRDQEANYRLAQTLSSRIARIPGAVDVRVHQLFDLPTLKLDIDRARVQSVGLSARDVAQNVLVSLSSSFQTAPAFWVDPNNGVSYSVAVQTPQYRIDSLQALANTPVGNVSTEPQLLANLTTTSPTTRAAEISHYNAQAMINVYASVEGRDLAGVAADVTKAIAEVRPHLPRGSDIVMRGQVETMEASFVGLGVGLLGAIALAYLLIVVNFQSWLDPFIIIMALPGALAGIAWTLLLTHTTLNVPSLTGAIMCMGVATANSILLVSFAREQMRLGKSAVDAALEAGFVRVRPVLMTALAMVIGMLPMAIGMGEGGEQNAPLGRAVAGGLTCATIATLFFVPCVFAIVHGRHRAASEEGR